MIAPVHGICLLLLTAAPAFASRDFVVAWERDEATLETSAPAGAFVVAWVHQSYGLPAERLDLPDGAGRAPAEGVHRGVRAGSTPARMAERPGESPARKSVRRATLAKVTFGLDARVTEDDIAGE